MERRTKVEPGSGKHSMFTHFPKDPNCDITCLLPRAHHLPRSLFLLPLQKNTQHKSVQCGHLQEHAVHHEHLHALPVDKQRHQESLWRENLQSGGNPRTTTTTKPSHCGGQRSAADIGDQLNSGHERPGEIHDLERRRRNLEELVFRAQIGLTAEEPVLSRQFFCMLTLSVNGEALRRLENVPVGEGAEAWRR